MKAVLPFLIFYAVYLFEKDRRGNTIFLLQSRYFLADIYIVIGAFCFVYLNTRQYGELTHVLVNRKYILFVCAVVEFIPNNAVEPLR